MRAFVGDGVMSKKGPTPPILFTLNENKEKFVETFGIGSHIAEFSQEMMDENPEFKKQLQIFCDQLCKELGIDAVKVHGISFSTVKYR